MWNEGVKDGSGSAETGKEDKNQNLKGLESQVRGVDSRVYHPKLKTKKWCDGIMLVTYKK